MAMSSLSSMDICPINFTAFNKLNNKLNNLEASLLFAKLKFHQTGSKIKKLNKTWVARTRKNMASWFGLSTKKVDNLLKLLEENSLIEKKIGLWYGTKRVFISTSDRVDEIAVNLKLMDILISHSGSLKNALIFSRIAYSFANTKITADGLKWCCMKKTILTEWSGLSTRTIDSIVKDLEKSGLVLKKKFLWRGKLQTHFHIPDFIIKIIKSKFNNNKSEVIHNQNCRRKAAKTGVSIRISTNQKKTNNNINLKDKKTTCDTTSYIKKALQTTIKNHKVKVSNLEELTKQIQFSVSNLKYQHKGVNSFKHAVARCMKILSQKKWKTPIGFTCHSEYGKKQYALKTEREKMWAEQKNSEIISSRGAFSAQDCTHKSIKETELTKKAMNIAEKISSIAREGASVGQDNAFLNYVEILQKELQNLVRQGADGYLITKFIKQSDFQNSNF